MASVVSENLGCINGDAEFYGAEVLKVNYALLMSLMEESLVEDHNDEQLNRVIRSLEAEINPNTMEGDGSSTEPEWLSEGDQDDQSWSEANLDGIDSPGSQDLDFQWVDTEPAPSSPSDDMSWYMECYMDEMDGVEFQEIGDYPQTCYGVPLEEQYYSSLWHETCDTMMYA